MLGTIGIEKYRILCVIGAKAHERHVEREIFVDVKVVADISDAVRTDQLKDTVDYVRLAELCEKIAKEGRYYLLEKYAGEVAKAIYNTFRVKSVWICVRKPASLEDAECSFVEVKIEG